MVPNLRHALLEASKGKPWSDVEAWSPLAKGSLLEITSGLQISTSICSSSIWKVVLGRMLAVLTLMPMSELLRSLKVSINLPLCDTYPQIAVDSVSPLPSCCKWHTAKLCGI
jgi:hypothetical protein